jgi:hypothetical protein
MEKKVMCAGSWLLSLAIMPFCLGGTAFAQQNSQGDVPKSQPSPNNPDLQQQKMQKSGRAVPNSGNATKPDHSSTSDQSTNSGETTKGGKRDKKKPHNQQTHGAQKHNPDNQA